ISRIGLSDVTIGFPGQPAWGDPPSTEARAIGATVGGSTGNPLQVWSLYVPNGRGIGDPHMDYKLDWLARLRDAGAGWLADAPEAGIVMCGDWNVAPFDEDVWSVDYYADKSHITPEERAGFHA